MITIQILSVLCALLISIEGSHGYILKKECVNGERIPMPGDCKKYFVCVNGEYIMHRCPRLAGDTSFDIMSSECISSQNATCFIQEHTECQVGQKNPVVDTLNKYSECFTNVIGSAYGMWFTMQCEDYFQYDPNLKMCVSKPTTTTTTTTSTTTTTTSTTTTSALTTTKGQLIIREDKTLTGHGSSVYGLAVLENGYLASGSGDGTMKIWDTNSGVCVRTLTGHGNSVYGLAVLENGYLASASYDKTVKIWDTNSGVCVRTLTGHRNSVWSLAVLENGYLASASGDYTVKIWNTNSGACVRTLTGHGGGVLSLAVLENGYLASASDDMTVKIWSISY